MTALSKIPLFLGLALFIPCAVSRPDDVRPVEVQIKEQEPGLFLIQWIVPKVLPPEAMPIPSLPEACRGEGERTVREQESAWINRRLYRCSDGLYGKTLGVRYPFYNPALTTVIRVDLLSGDRYAHLLAPSETVWEIPEESVGAITEALRSARRAVLEGVGHFVTGGVHLAFLLALCLVGDLASSIRLATAFAGGQLLGIVLRTSMAFSLEASLSETLVAVAVVLLARQALLAPPQRRPLTALVLASGLAHGAGVVGLFAPAADGSRSLYQAFVVLGMDASLICLAALVSKLAAWLRPAQRAVAAYGVGGVTVAFALNLIVLDPLAAARPESSSARLFAGSTPTSSTATPGSGRIAPQATEAPIQSFVAVTAFEVRHEVLVRLAGLARRFDLDEGDAIEVDGQEAIRSRIAELVTSQFEVRIDGSATEPLSKRVDFMTLDSRGALPRPVPVTESVDEALIGISVVYLTPQTPRNVSLTCSFEVTDSIPATITDPEETRSVTLIPDEPRLDWTNELTQNPTPRIEATTVEPATVRLPLVAAPFLVASIAFGILALRGRRRTASFALARVAFAIGLALSVFGEVALALPAPFSAEPAPAEAKRVLAGLLPNVYRAFEFREESAAYDRLAVSVVGETLTDVYLEHRRALEMEERGGARARVEAVNVIDVRDVSATTGDGFEAEATWEVGGTVTHFGHRHFRQNRYDARVAVVPADGSWKIRSIEILDEARLR